MFSRKYGRLGNMVLYNYESNTEFDRKIRKRILKIFYKLTIFNLESSVNKNAKLYDGGNIQYLL